MRKFNVEKILELAEECNGNRKFLLSEWVAVDDILDLLINGEWDNLGLRQKLFNTLSNENKKGD